MDPSLPRMDYSLFQTNPEYFKDYYQDAEEKITHRMPRWRCMAVVTTAFVYAYHGSNKVTRQSHSGHLLFVNWAPVKWLSRQQHTVDTRAFSSEFITMKHCIDNIEYLQFKLQMFGVPLAKNKQSTYILCDNKSLVKNSSNVDSKLNKKHSAIASNFMWWNMAAGVCTVAWIPTGENILDAMTKRLSEGMRDYLFGNWNY